VYLAAVAKLISGVELMSCSSGQRYPAAVVRRLCAASWVALSSLVALAPQTQAAKVDFNRDIRPVMLDAATARTLTRAKRACAWICAPTH
jgi:hypothetical protein